MKKIMIPLMALLLLLGGGAGAYFYMGKSEASVGEIKEAPKKAEGKEGEESKVTFLPMEPIILPIIGRDGISQTISMVISLQIDDATKVEEVKSHLPKLADAFLSDMYGSLSQQANMVGGVIKVSMLKTRLTEITNKVMGEDVVNGVLLQVLQQHPS